MSKLKNMKFIIKRNEECFYAEKFQDEYIVYHLQSKNQERLKADPFFDIYGGDLRLPILSFLDKMEKNLCLFSLNDQEFYFLSSLIAKIRRVIVTNHRKNLLHLLGIDKDHMMRNPNLGNHFSDLFLLIRNYNHLYSRVSSHDLTLDTFEEIINEDKPLLLSKEKTIDKIDKELDILMVRSRERVLEQNN